MKKVVFSFFALTVFLALSIWIRAQSDTHDTSSDPHKESARVVRVHTREELGSRGGVVAD